MITENDLRAAIAECQGERNPNANTCMKLAAYYIIMREQYGAEPQISFEPAPETVSSLEIVQYQSDTDFGQTIHGRSAADVFSVIDELASTIQIIQPRLYNGLMRKLKEIPSP